MLKTDGTVEAKGLWRHPNDLNAPEGSLYLADNVNISRDNIIERRRGFTDCSTNLPDALPEQLFNYGGNLYLNMDGKIYHQNGDCVWSRVTALSTINIYPRRYLLESGKIYLVEDPTNFQSRHSIRKIDLVNPFVSTLAGTSITTSTFPNSVDGAAFVARFSCPGDITLYGNYIYVADFGSCTVRRIDKTSGVTTTFAGVINTGGNVDGIGAAARFTSIQAICNDGTYLWVLDCASFFITGFPGGSVAFKRIEIATANVVTINATAYSAAAMKLFSPENGWTTAGHNYCYFTNTSKLVYGGSTSNDGIGHSIVRINKTTGATDQSWSGDWNTAAYAVGNAATTRYDSPKQIWGDLAEGYLYLCDSVNRVIRKVSIADGSSTLFAGTPGVAGVQDGPALSSKFSFPCAIQGDATTLWIGDETAIRTIDRATNIVSTYAITNGSGFNGPISYDVTGPA